MRKKSTKEKLVISRNLNAPRELVWEAWTNPETIKQWWGPKDFSCPYARIDLRKGGSYLICMRSPEGKDYWSTGIYKEVFPPQKVICSDSFADPDGNIVPASYYGFEEAFPLVMEFELMLDEINTKTRMTLIHTGIPEGVRSEQTKTGWNQSFDKLEAYFRTSSQ